ncbi:copper chaperone PCu(A)C [Leucothrix arctica]|uniref:Copper chaperone PCu(A)C n=1 Tax=Leucothrix arctica TaxID=1481894 RepID=A0A317CPP6_9GAMM|nr:copper chaperone PCu(A)C [Leucothrix arctica]PWQ98350.1 hypothetical protein DKT75_04270 [Leucothrix arctica]
MKTLIIGTLLTLGLINSASAQTFEVGKLTIETPYTRSTPPMTPVAGGFMTITNNGEEDDRLFAGTAPFSEAVEIHEMIMGENGVMRMQQTKGGLVIPAGKTVELKPGGLHIMFIGLSEQMIPDETHKSLLKFEHAGDVEIEFIVKDITKMPAAKMDHSKMNHGAMDQKAMPMMNDAKTDDAADKTHAHH